MPNHTGIRKVKDMWVCEDATGLLFVMTRPPDIDHQAMHVVDFDGFMKWVKTAERLAEAVNIAEWNNLADVPGGVGIRVADHECEELRDALNEYKLLKLSWERRK